MICRFRHMHRVCVLGVVAGGLLAVPGTARGQSARDSVELALDRPAPDIAIPLSPMREALERIEQKTGLRFAIDETLFDYMPYGKQTRIAVTIRDTSVRAGLSRMLDGLGLAMRVDKGAVGIRPGPVLRRLGRRLTAREIELLGRLASGPWSRLARGAAAVALDLRLPPETRPRERLDRALAQVHAPNALRQLEAACQTLGWVWYPQGDAVVVYPRAEDIRRRLSRPLDLDFHRIPLDELLVTLGQRVGVLVRFEPGALGKIAASQRTVDLTQRGVSVRQVLERICGNTGLRYELDGEGIFVHGPASEAIGPTAASIQQWVRIELELRSGVKMDVFLRQDQLPPDLHREMQEKLREVLKQP